MGKIERKKKLKNTTLLQTAFELFTEKGFAKTTIADIVNRAGLAKGTFYLYFKDKYDLRDQLIIHKTGQLFLRAHQAIAGRDIHGFENQMLFVVDHIIGDLEKDPALLRFIYKNLSWGIFKHTFEQTMTSESQQFYEYYLEQMKKDHIVCEEPDIVLFTIIELVGSTCCSCILKEGPVSMEEYLPYLHQVIRQILTVFTKQPVSGQEESDKTL